MSSTVLMAPTTITLPLVFLCILSSQVLLPLLASPTPQPSDETRTSSKGFSLELIPPHSPKSPLHKYYTSMQQRYYSLHGLYSTPIHRDGKYILLVEVGIGTFITIPEQGPSKKYYLQMDSGSDLTWVQCEECKLRRDGRCFTMEKQEVFPNRESKSYKPLICEPPEPLCTPRQCIDNNKYCAYFQQYADLTYSKGFLAKETFHFRSSTPSTKEAIFEGTVFGCGINSTSVLSDYEHKEWHVPGAGIFGLGRGALSFVRQMEQTTKGRFSYCIVNNANDGSVSGGKPMFLRFGDDIKPPQKLQTIKLLQDRSLYYVNLQGLGVNGKQLSIEPSVFERKKDGTGGCIVDSGASVSRFGQKVYDIFVQHLKANYFEIGTKGFEKFEDKHDRLCYKRKGQPQGYKDIPGINFYFDNSATLNVAPEQTFSRSLSARGFEVFCLEVLPRNSMTLTTVGAYQQADHKFIYDVKLNQLQFGPEDCANKG